MPNWKKLIVSGSDASLNNLIVNNAVTASFFKGDGSALTNVQTEVTEVSTVVDTFTSQTSVTTTHNFDTKNIIVSVYDNSDQVLIPASITTNTTNTVVTTFDVPTSGRVVVAKGGHIVTGIGTASNSDTLNGQSGSYYLDYDNFTNVPVGILSSSAQIAQEISGSLEGPLNVLRALTGSYATTGSNIFIGNQVITGSLNTSGSVVTFDAYPWPTIGQETHLLKTDGYSIVHNNISRSYGYHGIALEHIENGNNYYHNSLLLYTYNSGSFDFGGEVNIGPIRSHLRQYVSGSNSLANVSVQEREDGKSQALVYGDKVELGAYLGEDIQIGNTASLLSISASTVVIASDITASGHLIPGANETYDLGTPTARWRDLYLSGSTIFLGDTKITTDVSGNVEFRDRTTNTRKVLKVDEIELGSGASARRIKVDEGNIAFTTTGDTSITATTDAELNASSSALIAGYTAADSSLSSSLAADIATNSSDLSTHISDTSNPHNVTAAQVGLGNVTNESKATMFNSPAFTGNPTAPTQAGTDDSTKLATTAFVQGRIDAIIGTAGTTLDTLGELSASLANDQDALTALTTTVGTKLAKSANLSDLTDAAAARTNLGVDPAGTDNSTDVTLVTTSHDYLSITGQAITLGTIQNNDLANSSITVNGNATSLGGSVTLDADDIDDTSTTHKFATAAQLAQIATNANAISNLNNTYTTDAELNASSSALISGFTGADTALSSSLAADIAINTAKIGVTTETVRTAGALMDDEVDADIKTLSLPANTTISTFGRTLIDDTTAAAARTTLGVDAAGTDNSTDVTLAGSYDYITITGQTITRNQVDASTDISNLNTTNVSEGTRLYYTDSRVKSKLNTDLVVSGSATQVRTFLNVENGATADQTPSEIKTAYESNSNTNAFTDALLSKLNGIEAGATADQTAEEIQDIVGAMLTGNTETGITVTYQDADGTIDFVVATQSDENFTSALLSKLNGIETAADVTDYANVQAAGALMDNELTSITDVKALNQSVISGSSPAFSTANMSDATNKRFMTDAQESKLDGIASGAEVNQNAFSNIAVSGQSTVAADSKTDTLTLAAGSNVTLTTNATTDTITIASSHPSITAASSVNNSGRTFIQDITLDSNGHVTGITSATDSDTFTGTVTSVSGTGTKNGLTLSGTVTTSGNLTLGGTLAISNADWSGTDLAIVNGGTGASTAAGAASNLGLGVEDSPTFSGLTVSNNLTVNGNLTVLGDAVEIQVGSLSIEDKNILIASGAADSAAADGAGITIGGANESITWNHASSRFDISDDINVTGNITLSGTVDGVDIAALSTTVNNINTQVPAITSNGTTPSLNTGITDAEIRALINVEPGVDVQAYNSTLAAVAGGTYTGDDSITTVGTIGTGTWQGSVIASAYLDSDTAHLSGTQTFTGAKTFSGGLVASGGISGLTLANGISGTNFNITGVNQLEIADPGEGIVFKSGASGDMTLAIVDDASDNILRFSGTNAQLQVGTNRVLTVADEGSGNGLDADTLDGVHAASFTLRTDDYFKALSELPGSANLNTYRTSGYASQNANADAASGTNYPTPHAGMFEVVNDDTGNGVHTTQRYAKYNTNDFYARNYYNGSWTSWARFLTNEDISSTVQAYDADLTTLGGLAKTDGNFIVGNGTTWVVESGATARTSLGLGSLATLSTINNTNWSGTDLAIANGGTGASDAATARTNLGLGTAATAATTTSVTNGSTALPDGNAVYDFVTGQGYLTSYTETDTLATVTARGASTTTGLQLNSGATIDFNKTNATSGGDTSFLNLGYNGSWSSNADGMAAIEVNDGSGTVGKFGISYNTTDEGYFAVKDLYNGGSYGASGTVFKVDSDGDGYFSRNLVIAGDLSGVTDLYVADQIIHTGDTDTYIQFHAANEWRVVTGGAERLEVNNSQTTVNSALHVNGNILLTGTATTTNQGRTIDFTGFDKEGTTDFSDRAYISHTTNTGGHAGSVLVISSQNDSSDGIAFLTNASSKLKHNSNNIATEPWVTSQGYTTYTSNQATNTTSGVTFANVTASWLGGSTSQTRDKLRVWNDSTYSIGMKNGYDYGHLGTGEYAMSFQMSNDAGRGFWWGDSAHTDDQGAMSLTTQGKLVVAKSVSIGEGEAVTNPSDTPLYVYGSGSTVFDVQGSQGQLFSVTDDLTGEIFAVSDISGMPILSVDSTGIVTIDDTLRVTGDITAYYSSDERLKKNIKPIESPLEKLKLISGNTFEWDEKNPVHKNTGKDVGVIAQEIEKVLPEIVTERKGYKAVQYEKIVALLIESNKALLERVEELEKKLK